MNKSLEEFKTIMLATDLSDAASGALSYARQLALRFSSRLLIVHVIDAAPGTEKGHLCERIDRAEDELQNISAALSDESIHNATIVREGDVRETVLQLIRERDVELLVIGTRGLSFKGGPEPGADAGLGSVAEKLVRAMPCPVFTVGRSVRQDAFEATHLRRVLFPTDFSETSRAALGYAERLTRHVGGKLILLHVDEYGVDSLSTDVAAAGDKFKLLVTEMKEPSAAAEFIHRTGLPAEAIVSVAKERRVDFIVLGVHPGDQASGRRLHGIAYDVIRMSRCPVLTFCPTPAA